MAARSFETWQSEDLPPPWLQGRAGKIFHRVLGQAKDQLLAAAKVAVKARLVALCPLDALGWIGAERLLERYPVETDAQYRARLLAAWDAWAFAGTLRGVTSLLAAAGFTNVAIYDVHAAPAWWAAAWPPTSTVSNWSRFWVEIGEPFSTFGWQRLRWGDAGLKWGTGKTWGSTATVDHVRMVRGIIRKMKPAHTVCETIFVRLPNGSGGYVTANWPGME
jgi:hypothetical protein